MTVRVHGVSSYPIELILYGKKNLMFIHLHVNDNSKAIKTTDQGSKHEHSVTWEILKFQTDISSTAIYSNQIYTAGKKLSIV